MLAQFPSIVMSLLKCVEGDLNADSDMTAAVWTQFNSFLYWLYELAELGLCVPNRNEEDDLERLLYVYWFWMEEKLRPLLDALPVSNLRSSLAKFHKVIESLNLDSNSFSR